MNDEHWMTMALAQARHGIGKTAPNPPVGAVIVKDEILLGSGWHRKAGMPHAEREAIADAVARSGAQSLVGAMVARRRVCKDSSMQASPVWSMPARIPTPNMRDERIFC
jgi:pyrimidine deaminase RibD-like protein